MIDRVTAKIGRQAVRGPGRVQVVRRRIARRLPRLRRRGERWGVVRPSRRRRLDDRQGRNRPRAPRGGDHGADGSRPGDLYGELTRELGSRPMTGSRRPLLRAEGIAREAVAGAGPLHGAGRRADPERRDVRAGQWCGDRRSEGGHGERLVRGAPLRDRGHLQDLRGELPGTSHLARVLEEAQARGLVTQDTRCRKRSEVVNTRGRRRRLRKGRPMSKSKRARDSREDRWIRVAPLALDLSWSWNHATDEVWRQLDPICGKRRRSVGRPADGLARPIAARHGPIRIFRKTRGRHGPEEAA